jgi:hypothetical protein
MPISRRHLLAGAAATAAVAAMPAAQAIAAVVEAPVLTTYVPEAFRASPPMMPGYRFLSRVEFLEMLDKPPFELARGRLPWKVGNV